MSLRFQADNDLKLAIVKAIRRRVEVRPRNAAEGPYRQRESAIDFATAHEAGLGSVGDPELLERAARDNRVLVSHDRRTMLNCFRHHLAAGKPSPGVLIVSQGAPIGPVVEAIILLWAVADPSELRDQAHHLPSLIQHVFPR